MRKGGLWLLLAAATLALPLAAACNGGDGKATPTAALPEPTPGAGAVPPEIAAVILPMMPQAEDVPASLGQLEPPQTYTPDELFSIVQGLPSATPEDMASWRFLGGASAAFLNVEMAPEIGPEYVTASIQLHADADGAHRYFEFSKTFPSEITVRALEVQGGREVTAYSEFTEPQVAEETRYVAFTSKTAGEEPIEYQSYYVYARRGRILSILFARARAGNLSLDDLSELSRNMDARIIAAGG